MKYQKAKSILNQRKNLEDQLILALDKALSFKNQAIGVNHDVSREVNVLQSMISCCNADIVVEEVRIRAAKLEIDRLKSIQAQAGLDIAKARKKSETQEAEQNRFQNEASNADREVLKLRDRIALLDADVPEAMEVLKTVEGKKEERAKREELIRTQLDVQVEKAKKAGHTIRGNLDTIVKRLAR